MGSVSFGQCTNGVLQYGGSPVKVGDEEYSLFRDHEYVLLNGPASFLC